MATETITARDVAELIRLRKLKAELLFKKEFLTSSNNAYALREAELELKNVESHVGMIESKVARANLALILPNEDKIAELSEKINSAGHGAITEALKAKNGNLYMLLSERGKIIKQNFDLRYEIGKLNVLAHKLDAGRRNAIASFIRSADFEKMDGSVSGIGDDVLRSKISRVITRMAAVYSAAPSPPDECEISVDNQKVWVQKNVAAEVSKNIDETSRVIARVQLQNAERQIRKFTDEEETDFLKTQQAYLSLLKQRDELLKQHLEECSEHIELIGH